MCSPQNARILSCFAAIFQMCLVLSAAVVAVALPVAGGVEGAGRTVARC